MTDSRYSNFRLNLEQQRKRAKELLRAARRGDDTALERLAAQGAAATPGDAKLSGAQFTIARELRFTDWPALRRHIERMSEAPQPLDEDMRTLHVRCGSDIEHTLGEAGFTGDFYEHNYPYPIGPVREGPDALEQRARFLTSAYAADFEPKLQYADVLGALEASEQRLRDSGRNYDRVVIWSEYDCYDQLALLRLLGHYAGGIRPRHLELVSLDDFPGAARFLGLGQLPPEALRLLWHERRAADERQLALGREGWRALASPDPRTLASIARWRTPALPLLAPALRRHLSELPALTTGLSATESMALTVLAEGPMTLADLFRALTDRVDWLPGQGDLQVRDRVLAMERSTAPLIERSIAGESEATDGTRSMHGSSPWTDTLAITATGLAVLGGELDYLSLAPPPRWVGGVEIGPGLPDWRWDGDTAVLREPAAK